MCYAQLRDQRASIYTLVMCGMQVVITAVLTTSGQLASMKFAPGLHTAPMHTAPVHTAPMHAMNGSSGGASSYSSGGSGAAGGAQGDVADFYGDGGAGARASPL